MRGVGPVRSWFRASWRRPPNDLDANTLGGKSPRRGIRYVGVQDNRGGAGDDDRGQHGDKERAHDFLPDFGLSFSMKRPAPGSGGWWTVNPRARPPPDYSWHRRSRACPPSA